MATVQELERAFLNAHNAGDKQAAQALADALRSAMAAQPAEAPTAPPKERAMLKDILAGGVSGVGALAQLPGQLYGLATGDFSDTGLTKIGRQVREYGEEMKSPGLKQAEAERAAKIKEVGKEGEFQAGVTAFIETVKDPGLLTNFIAEQAPNLLPGLAVARGLARAGMATGAMRGAVATGAVQQGADIGAETFKRMHEELVSKGVSPEEATGQVLGYARWTGIKAGALSGLVNSLPGGRAIEEAMAKVPIKGGRLSSMVKGGAGEAAAEMVEEGGGKVLQNLAIRNVKPDQSLTEGLGETMGMAAVGGLGLGTAAGLSRRQQVETLPPEEQPAPVEEKQIPLLLEGKGAFVPVALPDGSVAMTREDLARYEEEQFRKKYEPQEVEKEQSLLGYEQFPFTPVVLPDGSVITSREELARYEEEQFSKKYAPQPADRRGEFEQPTVEEAKRPAMTYGEATQEVEFLKQQPKSPEVQARIQELQGLKMDMIMDGIRRAREPVRPELMQLRKQMESGAIPEDEITESVNQALADFRRATMKLETAKPPKSEVDLEIKDLTKEANELDKQMRALRGSAVDKSGDLKTILRGRLGPEDVFDISPEKSVAYLVAKEGKKFSILSDLVEDGILDRWLPPAMRHDSGTFDASDSQEYIKNLLRSEEAQNPRSKILEYETQIQIDNFAEQLSQIDQRISELKSPDIAQEAVAELPVEERRAEAAQLAPEEGFVGIEEPLPEPVEEEEYFPDQDELRGSAKFMRAEPGDIGSTIKQVQSVVDQITATWANTPKIRVVESLEDLPEKIRDQAVRDGVDPRGVFDPDTEQVFLVANRIRNRSDAAITLAHEALGHYGLRVVLGKNFKTMMADIYDKNKSVKTRADAYIKDGLDKTTAVEEVLAEMAQEVYDTRVPENRVKLTALQKVMNAVRQFLRRLGVPINTITDAEVLSLIANARQSIVSGPGKPVITEKGRAVYSVSQKVGAAKAAAKKSLQKRTLKKSQFEGVSDDLYADLEPVFAPERKTIIDKIDGMRDDFWMKLAQGVADQYRSIKDISQEAYMKARMSKTIDGALEGILFNGEVKLTDGALDIAKDTKGLLKVLEPVGAEVDRYQIWVALQRDAAITEKSNRARDEISAAEQEIKRMGGLKTEAGKAFDKETKKIIDDDSLSSAKKRDALKSLRKSLDDYRSDVDKAITSKRVEIGKLKSSIKAPSINPKIVERRDQLSSGKIGDKSRLEVYKQVQKDMNKLNQSVLKIAKEQGIIDEEAYKVYARDINYIPFYKMLDENSDVQAAATQSGLVNQYFSKALKGGEKPFGDLMENTLRNWSHILSAAMKNEAANATIKAAMKLDGAYPNLKVGLDWIDGKVYSSRTGEMVGDGSLKPEYTTSGKGTVKTVIDGKPAYFDVKEPLLLESIMSIGYMGPKSKFLEVARGFKNMLQFGVTLSPAFKIRNLIRDSVSAMAVTDLKKNPFANVIQGWAASDRNNPAHISALAGGAVFNFGSYYEGDQAKLIKRLLDKGVPTNTILDTPEKIKKASQFLWNKYQEWGNKSESANRMALYKQLRDQGYSHLEASFYARDMLDFSMQGSWPAFRFLTQVVPFLNARVQGLYKLGRDGLIPTSRVIYNTATGKPIEATDKQRAEQFSIIMSAVALASLALYMAFKDDDEFKKREQWDRDNFWWFKLPGMDQAYRIPKPFEVGAFGTIAERVAEQIFDQGVEGKVFKESLSRMLTDTFAVNLPQVAKPLVDLYANKDSFTGAPIETAGMERLSKAQRIAEKTSPLAIGLSEVANVFLPESKELSPVQTDYTIKAFFGWLGSTASWLSHYAVMPFSKSAYPDNNWTETLSMGFIKSLPATQSKYVTAFYENNKEISQAYADMRHFAQLGQADKVQEILKEKGDKIAMAKFYDNASKDMAKMRQAIQAIRNDENMTGAQKKEEIDRMKVLIGEIARQMEEARLEVKKSYAASQ